MPYSSLLAALLVALERALDPVVLQNRVGMRANAVKRTKRKNARNKKYNLFSHINDVDWHLRVDVFKELFKRMLGVSGSVGRKNKSHDKWKFSGILASSALNKVKVSL
jgi:hypothetical protein